MARRSPSMKQSKSAVRPSKKAKTKAKAKAKATFSNTHPARRRSMRIAARNAIANNTSRSSDDLKLLGLPPEVRNRIFQYALIEEEEEEIELSANTPTLPALLTVCKQIRSETIFLYYTMNNFYLTIDDYDAAAALPSLKTYMKYFVEIEGREDHSKFDINLTAGQTGSGCCRRIHTSEISYLGVEPESVDQVLLALEAVQDTIVEMDGRPWAEVEKVLEGYHRCVVLMDPAWATGR